MDAKQVAASVEAGQLLAQLYKALDSHHPEQLGELFSANGVWNRQGKALRGAKEIFAELSQRPKGRTTLHIVTNLVVEASGDALDTQYYLTVFRHDTEGEVKLPIAMGPIFAAIVCTARMVQENGRWRIASLSSQTLFQ